VKSRIAIAVCILTMTAATFAYGQGSDSSVVGSVAVQFQFMAGKKLMPAGKYEFVKSGSSKTLVLRGEKDSVQMRIVERIAETNPSEKHGARAVFNKVGDVKILSEFWPANNQDGYLLATSDEVHGHEVVQEK
jgi:hypothetical protein